MCQILNIKNLSQVIIFLLIPWAESFNTKIKYKLKVSSPIFIPLLTQEKKICEKKKYVKKSLSSYFNTLKHYYLIFYTIFFILNMSISQQGSRIIGINRDWN